jgi:hypothetical protein
LVNNEQIIRTTDITAKPRSYVGELGFRTGKEMPLQIDIGNGIFPSSMGTMTFDRAILYTLLYFLAFLNAYGY